MRCISLYTMKSTNKMMQIFPIPSNLLMWPWFDWCKIFIIVYHYCLPVNIFWKTVDFCQSIHYDIITSILDKYPCQWHCVKNITKRRTDGDAFKQNRQKTFYNKNTIPNDKRRYHEKTRLLSKATYLVKNACHAFEKSDPTHSNILCGQSNMCHSDLLPGTANNSFSARQAA